MTMTYADCAAAGMTQAETARAMGVTKQAVSLAARRLGLVFAEWGGHTPETIEKMRAANLGKKLSPETIEKMRAANLGKKLSPETIEKMRASKLGPLVALTETEMRDYTTLRKCGHTRAEALAAMGRMDLIGGDA